LLDGPVRAGHRDAALLIHGEIAGARAVAALGRTAQTDAGLQGLPARALPLAVPHIRALGIDLWLAAIAWGCAQIWVLVTHEDAAADREAVATQMRVAQSVLDSLGFAGERLRIIGGGEVSRLVMGLDAKVASASQPSPDSARTEPALQRLDRALQRASVPGLAHAAAFDAAADPRATLVRAVAHLRAQAGVAIDEAALRTALAEAAALVGAASP